jgi:hypothetical protein
MSHVALLGILRIFKVYTKNIFKKKTKSGIIGGNIIISYQLVAAVFPYVFVFLSLLLLSILILILLSLF